MTSVVFQPSYGQPQGYGSYSQPTESTYPQGGSTSSGYAQQGYSQQPPAAGDNFYSDKNMVH